MCVMFIASGAFAADKAADKFVQPIRDGIGIYKNEIRDINEKPIVNVGTKDKLLVLAIGKLYYQVQAPTGETGWVEKRLVGTSLKSATFVFDDAQVVGYLDNPTPVYIIDADNPNADPIKLDRSFADALRDNVDRETIERMAR
jgi:hypothetical protein